MEQGQEKSQAQIKKEREKLLQKAKKIKAVFDRGTPEEQANIHNAYHEFLKQHGISEEEVDGIKNERVFTIQFEDDALILTNVILSVCPFTKIECTELYVKCTLDDEDFKEVIEKYRVFIKAWRSHKELFIMCFFTKHDEHFKMDNYAYEKFMKSNKPKNEDIVRAEEEDNKMEEAISNKSVNNRSSGGFIESKQTPEMIERQRLVSIMNKIIHFLPSIYYQRKHGGENKKPDLKLKKQNS
jgi:hypothetical protein